MELKVKNKIKKKWKNNFFLFLETKKKYFFN